MDSVSVIGAGLAGLSCARALAEGGLRVTLVSRLVSERAQSVLAEGGINAALDVMGEHDSVSEHYTDTLAAGCHMADPNAVWGLCSEAPAIIGDLVSLGVPFQREGGHLVQRNFGGQRKKRTAFAKSSTGKVLMSALIDRVRALEDEGRIRRLSHHDLVGISLKGDACVGCVAKDTYSGATVNLEGPVVLCAGGLQGIFGPRTTGTTANTGDVAALALKAGAAAADLEFIQYHPTTVPIADKRLLVSEAARGEGGRLFTLKGTERYYFMEARYPELGNLMPRDVVSREEHAILHDPTYTGGIFLDLCGIDRRVWAERLSDLREEVEHYLGLDPTREPVPVTPGIHYSMGGIWVDEHHRTSVTGLLAAGECASIYHGANRLGGNSLLGAIYGGRVAARTLLGSQLPNSTGSIATIWADDEAEPQETTRVADILAEAMGIVRDDAGLMAGLEALQHGGAGMRRTLAEALLRSALMRQESRGAHVRSDYPESSEDFRQRILCTWESGELHLTLCPIPERRYADADEKGANS